MGPVKKTIAILFATFGLWGIFAFVATIGRWLLIARWKPYGNEWILSAPGVYDWLLAGDSWAGLRVALLYINNLLPYPFAMFVLMAVLIWCWNKFTYQHFGLRPDGAALCPDCGITLQITADGKRGYCKDCENWHGVPDGWHLLHTTIALHDIQREIQKLKETERYK